jgi:hypothetical protein
MAQQPESQPSDTTDRLRSDIDHGRTGDKVDFPDPAAAPLGTDEEAAGAGPTAAAIAQARRFETGRKAYSPQRQAGVGSAWVLIVFIVVCLGAIGAWSLLHWERS